jgi:maltose alpha-D-glucosyltransferase/alpha-amylase
VRDFYVWSDRPDKYRQARVIFKDYESSNWTWDPVAEAYYWHRFYHHQPDLNFENPDVLKAVLRVLDHWLRIGVDGIRLNAVAYLFEREGTDCENLPETHALLKHLRQHVDARYRSRVLLADANQWPEDAVAYFGDGDECHAAFHFPLMPRLFMAAHMEDRGPIVDVLQQTPSGPPGAQWVLFLRNHDELTLEMVTEEERTAMYRYYARDPQARVHRGIRRRLAPLMANDRRQIELLSGLLLSLPGTPVIYYGDEIGMGDNIYLGDRAGVRTPMQWGPERNAGFSAAPMQQLFLPAVTDPRYHYETVNVRNQLDNPASLLSWVKRAIQVRKRSAGLTGGQLELLDVPNHKLLAYLRRGPETVLVVANLSRHTQAAQLDLAEFAGRVPVEMLGQVPLPPIGALPYMLTLPPYGFFWLALREADQLTDSGPLSAGHSLRDGPPPAVIQLDGAPDSIFQQANWELIERLLPSFLSTRRWFGGKARPLRAARLVDMIPLRITVRGSEVRLAVIQAEYVEGTAEWYLVPLGISTTEQIRWLDGLPAQAILAELRTTQGGFPQLLALYDVFGEEEFGDGILEMIGGRRSASGLQGRLKTSTSRVYRQLRGSPSQRLPSRALKAETSNSTAFFGDRLMLKLCRRMDEGTNPELEIGEFLTNEVAFANIPPVAGAIEYETAGQEPATVAILSGFVPNEGSAWEHALSALGGFFERVGNRSPIAAAPPGPRGPANDELPDDIRESFGGFLHSAELLGRRTAEMHVSLATDTGNVAFTPEPFTRHYQRAVYQHLRNQTEQNMRLLQRRLDSLPAGSRGSAEQVLAGRASIDGRLRVLLEETIAATRTRCHGDFHLGQVLYTGSDFVIIDFEGEPARPIAERRIKAPPLRDVAGMLRSFDYACHIAYRDQFQSLVLAEEDRRQLAGWIRHWVGWVSQVYLRTYLTVAAGASFIPDTATGLRTLLDAYLLEKALYELGYELNNRPDWTHIPLGGILRLLESEETN